MEGIHILDVFRYYSIKEVRIETMKNLQLKSFSVTYSSDFVDFSLENLGAGVIGESLVGTTVVDEYTEAFIYSLTFLLSMVYMGPIIESNVGRSRKPFNIPKRIIPVQQWKKTSKM